MSTNIPHFRTVLHGYEPTQVDVLVHRVHKALNGQGSISLDEISVATFSTTIRGYSPDEVGAWLEAAATRLASGAGTVEPDPVDDPPPSTPTSPFSRYSPSSSHPEPKRPVTAMEPPKPTSNPPGVMDNIASYSARRRARVLHPPEFGVTSVRPGYRCGPVNEFVQYVLERADSGAEIDLRKLVHVEFPRTRVRKGYDQDDVDEWVDSAIAYFRHRDSG